MKRLLIITALLTLAGCATLPDWPRPDPQPEPQQYADAIDAASVTWLTPDNVGAWPATQPLTVRMDATRIYHMTPALTAWPKVRDGNDWLVATPVVIAKIGNTWYGVSHEHIRPTTTWRGRNTLNQDHIKKREFPPDWTPRQGEELYWCVVGLNRMNFRNVQERTQIVRMDWE